MPLLFWVEFTPNLLMKICCEQINIDSAACDGIEMFCNPILTMLFYVLYR
jgi:hypothetical protein